MAIFRAGCFPLPVYEVKEVARNSDSPFPRAKAIYVATTSPPLLKFTEHIRRMSRHVSLCF